MVIKGSDGCCLVQRTSDTKKKKETIRKTEWVQVAAWDTCSPKSSRIVISTSSKEEKQMSFAEEFGSNSIYSQHPSEQEPPPLRINLTDGVN